MYMSNAQVAATYPNGTIWPWNLIQTLFADSRDALILLDSYAQVVAANTEWQLFCGTDSGLVGQLLAEVFADKERSEVVQLLRRAMNAESMMDEEVTLRHVRGFDFRIGLRVSPVHETSGAIIGYLARLRATTGVTRMLN